MVLGGVNREVFESQAEKRRQRGRELSTREEERKNRQKRRDGRGTEAEWQMTPVRKPPPDWADVAEAPRPAMPGTAKSGKLFYGIWNLHLMDMSLSQHEAQ